MNEKDNAVKPAMLCPVCKSEIVITGQEKLETLSEHVFDPNGEVSLKDKYECMNESCEGFNRIFWNEFGGMYSEWAVSLCEAPINFIDDNNAPFGTIERQINVTVGKKDENFYLIKNLLGWKLRVEWKYESNDDGDILSKKPKLQWITPRNTLHVSGIRMFFYTIGKYKRLRRGYYVIGTDKVEDCFKMTWDKRWWKIASVYFLRVFHPFAYYKSLKQ